MNRLGVPFGVSTRPRKIQQTNMKKPLQTFQHNFLWEFQDSKRVSAVVAS